MFLSHFDLMGNLTLHVVLYFPKNIWGYSVLQYIVYISLDNRQTALEAHSLSNDGVKIKLS